MRRSVNENSPIISFNPNSPISEIYRLLRAKIQFFFKDQDLKTLVVTSSQPGEGKSTTISNLAVAYAQEGKQVLLIDADLRKPSLHRMFSVLNSEGLSTLLSGHTSFKEVIQKTTVERLSLLPSGPIPMDPSELLDSSAMRELLELSKNKYDVILLDAPSVLSVSDTVIVSAWCDGVIMVAAVGKVKKAHLRKAKEQLDHVNAKMMGIVLN